MWLAGLGFKRKSPEFNAVLNALPGVLTREVPDFTLQELEVMNESIFMYDAETNGDVLPGNIFTSLFKSRYDVPDSSVVSLMMLSQSINHMFLDRFGQLQLSTENISS